MPPTLALRPADDADPAAGSADGSRGWPWLAGRRMRQAATTVLGLEIALVIGFAAVYRPFDLNIYLWGGRAVTHGLRLYLVQPDANWFTYPPFAAALFTPLAAIPAVATKLAWELGSVAALAWACALTLKLAGRRPSAAVTVAMVAAGADPGRP